MKLNIGSGYIGHVEEMRDWTGMDFAYEPDKPEWQKGEYIQGYIKHDMTKFLYPLGDESVDCIFASHIFEHFTYDQTLPVMRECLRILKKGNPIRIICPDPRIFVRNWQARNEAFVLGCYGQQNWDRWDYGNLLNIGFTDMFFHDHYDHNLCSSIDFLMIVMIRAGFNKVVEVTSANTLFPEYFGKKEDDGKESIFGNRPIMSYYLEGVK